MKILKVFFLLFLIPALATAQVIDFSQYAKQSEVELLQKQVKELQGQLSGGETPTPGKCEAGPEIRSITNISSNQITVQFHGVNVTKIKRVITPSASHTVVAQDVIEPTSNTQTFSFSPLAPGKYELTYSGVNCSGSSSMQFEIKDEGTTSPKPQPGLIYEMIINTTGRGFSGDSPTGLESDFPAYIDKFKYSWGWGITGIRVCVRWYDWEPREGDYKVQGLKNLIGFCRERGLSLSLCFWPVRRGTDAMMTSQVMTNTGKPFFSVNIGDVFEASERTPAFVDPLANLRIYASVKKLSEVLYTYEKAGYISLGGGTAEEMVWPFRGAEITDFSPENMASFKEWAKQRGITSATSPEVYYEAPMWTVNKSYESGKEWLRHQTWALRKYFDNFVQAVHAGNAKGRACYFTASVGSQAHDWAQDGFLGYLAANADEFYHTDGNTIYDVWRKELGVNVGIGTLGIPSSCEYDPEDLGDASGGGFNGDNLERNASKAYARGAQKVHLAMHFHDYQISGLENSLRKLKNNYVGKSWTAPTGPVKTVEITDGLWSRKSLYGDDVSTYIKSVATGFWGGVQP